MTTKNRTARTMRIKAAAWALVLALGSCAQAVGGEYWHPEPYREGVLQRFHPVGGWHPDGGGLLCWWNPHCFPRCAGPDDYCRKPPPNVCWPPYPPYYIWGPPQIAHPLPPTVAR
jgi:hypothetical protein